ncbi:transposase [Methanospirillum sp. J.3.6.1-F.2.7.3]|mgnify:CR=1 FL=1|jgi:putative transposase|uniref:Transposase n=1 Tax=Methanospirillum purgamenti TaxID=2834276 RepID=A0A8E7AW08_9EURY|nr:MULTISPECIES: helix-turn-helix domain-containing protein [Methanospirillum]NLW76163.1 transposase [Methanomicrobiales archaeon]MDX8552007.1 transposase [Methanospirillum hungatei]QVV87863.1 transposase [Methanospirillum sp. J.3.6.1-F.2.7.3]QVV88370.1 transposase [Methanospirillum sp. J.3.6.1-F.2.7.3]QVV89724.1 transposase [Methanospirillum sp. J.3.6.1-F.2.7.3]
MVNVEQIPIIFHFSQGELVKKIKEYELGAKILKRLTFINLRYSGKTIKESSDLLGISIVTGYTWQERWNSEGYAGLVPKYAGGRPSKLTDQQKEELWEVLHTRDYWTTLEVKHLIQLKFSIEYSMDQIRRILKSYEMLFGKLYPQDYRRPDDAEIIFKKNSKNE